MNEKTLEQSELIRCLVEDGSRKCREKHGFESCNDCTSYDPPGCIYRVAESVKWMAVNENTLADLSLKLSKALCAMNSCDCQECEEKWGRVVAAFAELDAALARPPAGEDAVGELLLMLKGASHLSVEAQKLIAAVAAEHAGERVVTLDVPEGGRADASVLSDGMGSVKWYTNEPGTYRLAIRRLPDPPKPSARGPWRLKTGRMICAECQQDVPPKWLMCDNGDCPQYGKPWGMPRDLPSGEEVGG